MQAAKYNIVLLVVRQLYRKGMRTITSSQLRQTIEQIFMGDPNEWTIPVYKYYKAERKGIWDLWNFTDRWGKGLRYIVDKGFLKTKGKRTKVGTIKGSNIIILRDFTNEEIFGKRKLEVLLKYGL